ncbi:MAG TPA: 3-hexulose-6-phosphate synthase [Planctomycetota bacterium]|nr:3-hexulose-6-phosphate synthase [Planctomycetota bacterium]
MRSPPTTAELQVALDFLELSRALRVAREAASAGAEILEAGTPLIKSEGLDAVRALRKEFPDRRIVADMKTMDAGRAEMESAAKAGADVVTVLGAASDATVRECVEAARNYGFEVEADLINVSDPAARARELESLGVGLVGVHCPIDEQMRGRDPFEVLRKVRSAVSLPLAVAGGITSESAPGAVAAGADVVVVGGAIAKSADAAAATRAIREAMRTGVGVRSHLYRRAVSTEEIRAALALLSTPNLSDAMHRSGDLDGLRAIQSGAKAFGPAIPVRTCPGDWAKPVEAIDHAAEGEVIVIESGGRAPAVWGELASESCLQKKIAAVVIDGAVRDVDAIRAIGFPVWARVVTPTAGEPKGFGEIGAPITISGVRILPGDWIVADDSGVVRLPKDRLSEVVNRGMDVLEKENRLRAEIRGGSTLSKIGEILRWEKQ